MKVSVAGIVTLGAFALMTPVGATPGDQGGPLPALPTTARITVPVDGTNLPAKSLAWARKGDAAVRSGDFALASRQFALAASNAPHDPVLRVMLGITLAAVGESEQSLAEIRRAVALADDDPIAAMLLQSELSATGDPNEAQALDLEVHRRFAPPRGQKGLDTSNSIARFQQRITQEPDSPILQLLLGDACQLRQDWEGADRAYANAAHLAPRWSKPLINRGLAQLAAQQFAAAIQTFSTAMHLDSTNPQTRVWLADAELHNGGNEYAISLLHGLYTNTKEVSPAVREQAAIGLGQAYSNTKRYQLAVLSLGEAQKLSPTDPAPAALLGEVQLQAGNFDAATTAYQDAIRLSETANSVFSDRLVLYRALAEAQISAHRPEDALKTIRQSEDLDPGNSALWHRLTAQAQFDRGNAAAGREELTQALNAEEDRYPFDTLNAIAARNLLTDFRSQYQALLDGSARASSTFSVAGSTSAPVASATSAATKTAPRRVAIHIDPETNSGAQAHADETRALAALAAIARYQNRTEDELALRHRLTELRTRATDWYLLAEACDDKARMPIPAREAYRKALELRTGLSDAQFARATKRLEVLTSAAYKP